MIILTISQTESASSASFRWLPTHVKLVQEMAASWGFWMDLFDSHLPMLMSDDDLLLVTHGFLEESNI